VRGSGTEPKIKYYIFAQRRPEKKTFTTEQLLKVKVETGERLEKVWSWLEEDAHYRVAR
jgi:hypothetical protein